MKAKSRLVRPLSLFSSKESKALSDVASERQAHSLLKGGEKRSYEEGELVDAALCYLSHARGEALYDRGVPLGWPWSKRAWSPNKGRGGSVRQDLVKACALIVAEIERLDKEEGEEV